MKPELLIGKHKDIPRGSFEVCRTLGVEDGERVEDSELVFVGDGSLAGDLIGFGVIKMIIDEEFQALLIENPEEEMI